MNITGNQERFNIETKHIKALVNKTTTKDGCVFVAQLRFKHANKTIATIELEKYKDVISAVHDYDTSIELVAGWK